MKAYNQHDAFIVVHGEETMAYTASALAFMFENLDKTIIVTDSDLKSAIKVASNYSIPEVLLCVNGKIIRGCRGAKTLARGVVSPKFPIIGTCGKNIALKKHLMLDNPVNPLKLSQVNPTKRIVVVKMFPGIDGAYILGIARGGNLFGVILESYGEGNAPMDENFITAIKVLIDKGTVMINVSQDGESNDRMLQSVGVISGLDMTTEAALAKLYLIISNLPKYDRELIQKLMHLNMRGEIGSPTPVVG
jgi:L-asparaginase